MPIGAAADLHRFSGTSLLFSRPILAPFFHVPFISFFSSQLLSTSVGSLHFSCTCSIAVSVRLDDSVANFFDDSIELPFHWIMVIRLCYHLRVMYNHEADCTRKLAQSTSRYYFVLQSLHKVLPSTTSFYK